MENTGVNTKLFSNPGAKIKRVSIVVFWITVCASVILAFVYGIDTEYYYRSIEKYFVMNWIPFLLFLIVVPVVSLCFNDFSRGFR